MISSHLTIGDIAKTFGVTEWRARRAVDSLSQEIPRAGRYRLVPRSLLGEVAVELKHRGWLPSIEEVTTS